MHVMFPLVTPKVRKSWAVLLLGFRPQVGATILRNLLWFGSSQTLFYLLWVSVSDLRMRTRFIRVLVCCWVPFWCVMVGLTSAVKLVS